jgi:hypothetical protein
MSCKKYKVCNDAERKVKKSQEAVFVHGNYQTAGKAKANIFVLSGWI